MNRLTSKMHSGRKILLVFVVLIVGTSGLIDLGDLFIYSSQAIPSYIIQDNTENNTISDDQATLGRVLFYDKRLSSNDSIACASCHKQEFAFGDTSLVSKGVNGHTVRHSMRLVNARFSETEKFFWDKRVNSLEEQILDPIRNHIEMGYSGKLGDPEISDLINKLSGLDYYQVLFNYVFGDTIITEERIANSISQFIRSIQSFDSKFDVGMEQSNNEVHVPFPNFTDQENLGKSLFMESADFEVPSNGDSLSGNRIGGGVGCASCHRPPEFDIDPFTENNNVITSTSSPFDLVLNITKSPTLRDLFSRGGQLNGPLMHNAIMTDFQLVLDHYNNIEYDEVSNPNLDIRLMGIPDGTSFLKGPGQKLNLSQEEREALIAFVKTLSGHNLYNDLKWSVPFDDSGHIEIKGEMASLFNPEWSISISPNPFLDHIVLKGNLAKCNVVLINMSGEIYKKWENTTLPLTISSGNISTGLCYIVISDSNNRLVSVKKLVHIH